MKNRRSFLATVASGGVGFALAKSEPAVAQVTPASSPSPAASGKPASADAVAMAAGMRARFDRSLSDDEMLTIARAIDTNNDAAKVLNPKKKRLKNGDAPIVRFSVAGGEL